MEIKKIVLSLLYQSQQKLKQMTYELKQTQLKNGKFHYQVIDENGNVISERESTRQYVACTIDGQFYFGRLDLINKGDHGKWVKDCLIDMNLSIDEFNKKYKGYKFTYEELINISTRNYNNYVTIAYKK